jgi:Fe-S cluster assembly protein SufD
MTAVAEHTAEWLAAFTRQDAAAPWLQDLRDAAFQRFSELGFPTTHDEEWRFTNVARIARANFSPLAVPIGFRGVPDGVETIRPEDGALYLACLASYDRNPFVALNTAFIRDFVCLGVPKGAIIAEPIRLEFLSSGGSQPTVSHPRVLIVVGPDAHCTIVESYVGGGSYFTNAVTEIVVGDRAVVDHYKLQRESLDAFHVATLQAKVGRSASFSTHNISLGAALTRNDVGAVLAEGADATLNGLYIAGGSQHVDNHTVIDHAKPHGVSHELYKGIVDGQASAVFNGRIIVRKDAQKTDSKQTNKNLVLSGDAVINTKPELQILADDVRCTHGATIGQLDAEALFYIQSRGVGAREARSLLTYAFAQDVVDRIKVKTLRDSLERVLFEKFHEHAEQ